MNGFPAKSNEADEVGELTATNSSEAEGTIGATIETIVECIDYAGEILVDVLDAVS